MNIQKMIEEIKKLDTLYGMTKEEMENNHEHL